jgi:uncharacterized protein (TIGR02646 family)
MPPDERRAVADRAWENKSMARFNEVRATLTAMCSGIERCMYCEDSAWTDIDHFVPKAIEPCAAFVWSNYLGACSGCNSNYKRSEYPTAPDESGLLLDPTRDDPRDHLVFSPSTGLYDAIAESVMADESIRVFGLNRAGLAMGRRDAWILLQLAVVAYANALADGNDVAAAMYKAVVSRQPFAGVLKALVHSAEAAATIGVSSDFLEAIEAHPEVRNWPESLFAPDV